MTIVFTLPYPPSVNGLFATAGRKRIKSKAYKAWIEEAALAIRQQHVPLTLGKVIVGYEVGRPQDKRRRDLGNLHKAMDDLLVSCAVIGDDSMIEGYAPFCWVDGREGVTVTVRPA